VVAIPTKRTDRKLVSFLTDDEVDALLAPPDRHTWIGRRDDTLLLVAIHTGLRVSELTSLTCGDIELGTGAHLRCHGKGRLEDGSSGEVVVRPQRADHTANHPGVRGASRLAGRTARTTRRHRVPEPSPRAPQRRRRRRPRHPPHARRGQTVSISRLATRTVTPHVLRHTCAMRPLAVGIDTSIIALWVGHEGVETTQTYLHADLAIKERALARTAPTDTTPGRSRAPDALLAFLESL